MPIIECSLLILADADDDDDDGVVVDLSLLLLKVLYVRKNYIWLILLMRLIASHMEVHLEIYLKLVIR